jgi:uncharacterized YccA/Bax inhibitor family protein
MRSGNPALNDRVFTAEGTADHSMTLQGTVVKTAVLLALVVVGAAFTWERTLTNPQFGYPIAMVGFLAGLVVSLVIMFKPTSSPILAPIYAVAEGVALGAISAIFQRMYPGIVASAVAITFGTLAALLAVYSTGLIKATENFKLGVAAATGGICLVYLATIVLGFFGINIPYIHGSGLIGIGFSLFVVVLAALNLVLDFDFIEQGVEHGAPKYMEWYGAFGLLVTLVWLYIEVLRLLAKLQSRD